MASQTQLEGMKIGKGVLLNKNVAHNATDAVASSVLFQDANGSDSSVVCIHSDKAGTALNFKVYVEDPSQENTGTAEITSTSGSFLLYERNVAANQVTRINVPGGFGSRMFCVFKPDATDTAAVKIWAWSR